MSFLVRFLPCDFFRLANIQCLHFDDKSGWMMPMQVYQDVSPMTAVHQLQSFVWVITKQQHSIQLIDSPIPTSIQLLSLPSLALSQSSDRWWQQNKRDGNIVKFRKGQCFVASIEYHHETQVQQLSGCQRQHGTLSWSYVRLSSSGLSSSASK